MNPIINPLWFYLISIVDNFVVLGGILVTFGAIAAVLLGIFYFCEKDSSYCNDEAASAYKRNSKRGFIIAIVFGILLVLTPSKETCYQMMAASLATPDNIEAVVDTTKNGVEWLVDTITEAADKLSNDESESVDE